MFVLNKLSESKLSESNLNLDKKKPNHVNNDNKHILQKNTTFTGNTVNV